MILTKLISAYQTLDWIFCYIHTEINFESKMNTIFIRLTAIFLFFLLFSCSSTGKINTLKPEPSTNVAMAYKTTTSFVSMPMEITLKEIENQLNKSLNGLIYKDTILSDDKTEMKIWKTAPIKLTEKMAK